jgi:hypothetical protein
MSVEKAGIAACFFCFECGAIFTTEIDKRQHLEKEQLETERIKIKATTRPEPPRSSLPLPEVQEPVTTGIEEAKEYEQLAELLRHLYSI